jgi:DNA-binding beta-propeller fold protein YncE
MKKTLFSLAVTAVFLGGTASAAAATNPYRGRQERAETFQFAVKPGVKKQGTKYVISFASKAACDATVAIVDGKGKIVRHLASGVLGKNAPWPFKQNSLQQSIEWDGKDDRGKPVPAGCKVKVSLGLKPELDRILGWAPGRFRSAVGLAVGPRGKLFVLGGSHGSGESFTVSPNVRVFDRKGQYLRQILPHMSSVPPERVTLAKWTKTSWGKPVPDRSRTAIPTALYRYGEMCANVVRQTPVVTADGRFVFITESTRRDRKRRLIFVDVRDGATPPGSVVELKGGEMLGAGPLQMALSPDGKWLYLTGAEYTSWDKGAKAKNAHAVFRTSMKKPGEVKVFVGEHKKPGKSKGQFNMARSVACDKAGNVYVTDYGNDRLQVFKPDGTWLKTIATKAPQQVAVNRKTGEIYVLQRSGRLTMKLVKLGGLAAPAVKASVEVRCNTKSFNYQPVFCLDAGASPPVIWVSMGFNVLRYEDNGGSFKKTRELPEVPKGWGRWNAMANQCSLAADPYREELYIREDGMCYAGGLIRVDGRSGKFIERFSRRKSADGIEQVGVGPDRMVYMRVTHAGRWLVRYDPDKREYGTFPGAQPVKGMKHKGAPVTGIHILANRAVRTFQDMMGVAPNGDIYVPAGIRKEDIPLLKEAGLPWPLHKRIYHSAFFGSLLKVYSPEGKLKCLSALPGLGSSNGVRIGRSGAVYIALECKPAGGVGPEGIAPGSKFNGGIWGTLVKFDSALNKYPVGKIEGRWREKVKGKPTHRWGGHGARDHNDVRMKNMHWDYGGVSPLMQGGCVCIKSIFDLDGFERVFVPAMQTCTVNVLDANGNIVVRLGGYGNADCRGKDSPVPDPKTGELRPRRPDDPKDLKSPLSEPNLGFIHPNFIAVTDEAVYVNDRGNERIVRAKLGYHAEETVTVP